MEQCPGPVLSFCRQPESEQEQFACGSSRGEQQFGSVWFHGWKHPQVRNPLFPCLLCETLHCVICDTHACSQTRLGTPLPSVRPCHCVMGETLSSVKPCLSVRASVRLLLSVRPCILWGLAFCGTLASVRLCLLWGPSFCETLALFILWYPAFWETLPLFNGRDPVFCEALPFCETLPSLMCETLPSVLIYIEKCATCL